ncbi:MAG: DNA-binding protein [Paenibacillaceae bacterium]|jgi:spoIIIJ-associated protein|nr:DNA-binding protein [Paenibacillaceae bacterium]
MTTKTLIVTGKTVEEAVKLGLSQWNVPESRVKVEVLVQAAKGLFGLFGAKDAQVRLELIPDAVEEAVAFLDEVFSTMKVNASIERKDDRDGILLNVTGGELGILIGRRGQTLDSLQYLVNIVANRYSDKHIRIILDAEQFRERRRKTLEELSARLATRVVRTKKDVVLEPMSPADRKVIHFQLQDHPSVRTYSKGDEPNRRVVISLR